MLYTWRPATGNDVAEIVAVSQLQLESEIDQFFRPEPLALARNITHAVVTQFFQPASEQLLVAVDTNHRIIAYTWAKAFQRAHWSDDNMINICMAHVDLGLSTRVRLALLTDMLNLWEQFAQQNQHTVICSTTMRESQTAFLRLHQRHGYIIRGSYAYKRLEHNSTTTQARPANSLDPE